jgi:hypothetical protein
MCDDCNRISADISDRIGMRYSTLCQPCHQAFMARMASLKVAASKADIDYRNTLAKMEAIDLEEDDFFFWL